MSAKLIFMTGSILVLVALAVLFYDRPSLGWQEFEQRLPAVIEGSGLRMLAMETKDPNSVPLPLSHRLRSWLSWRKTDLLVGTGFPESVLQLTLRREEGAPFDCLVRYHESKVACVVIPFTPGTKQDMLTLKEALAAAFPEVPISIEDVASP